MPIYEFECTSYGEKFESLRSIKESDSKVKCPKCGAHYARKIYSVFARASSGKSCAPNGST